MALAEAVEIVPSALVRTHINKDALQLAKELLGDFDLLQDGCRIGH